VTVTAFLVVILILAGIVLPRIFVPTNIMTPEALIEILQKSSNPIWSLVLSQSPVDTELIYFLLKGSNPTITSSDFLRIGSLQFTVSTMAEWHALIIGKDGILSVASWPTYDPEYLEVKEKNIAVQVNGKVRGTGLLSDIDDEDTVKEKAMKDEMELLKSEYDRTKRLFETSCKKKQLDDHVIQEILERTRGVLSKKYETEVSIERQIKQLPSHLDLNLFLEKWYKQKSDVEETLSSIKAKIKIGRAHV
jgi:hypothetical protein